MSHPADTLGAVTDAQPLGYRYRLYPSPAQEAALRRTLAHGRVVWNWAVGRRLDLWREEGASIPHLELSHELTDLRGTESCWWLRESSQNAQEQVLRDLDRAFRSWWAGDARRPRYRRKGTDRSARWTVNGFRLRDGHLVVAGVPGPLEVRWSRGLPSVPRSVTVSIDAAGRWHASFRVEVLPSAAALTERAVGVDLGLRSDNLAVCSDGASEWRVSNARHLRARQRYLRRCQRALSRKDKGSANRSKACRRLARAHARVADTRRDALHKATTAIVASADVICVEDLAVKAMGSRRGRLGRSVADASLGELRHQLAYKAALAAKTLVVVNRWEPTSTRCSRCRATTKLGRGQRIFRCNACGLVADRDDNAARNIRAAGLAVLACEGTTKTRPSSDVGQVRRSRNVPAVRPGIPVLEGR